MKISVAIIALFLSAGMVNADPTRIEVYPEGQAFVDVRKGDTLGKIANRLLPDNPALRERLVKDIVELNPRAFIDRNPNRLKAGARLWLPGHVAQLKTALDKDNYHIRAFSWGYIRQAK